VSSLPIALGLLTATTGSGFFLVILFFPNEFRAIIQLECERMSSQLMALGLLTTIAGISSGFWLIFVGCFTSILSYQTILTSDFSLLIGVGCGWHPID
jgi:hypothetical protein